MKQLIFIFYNSAIKMKIVNDIIDAYNITNDKSDAKIIIHNISEYEWSLIKIYKLNMWQYVSDLVI